MGNFENYFPIDTSGKTIKQYCPNPKPLRAPVQVCTININ